MNHTTTARFAMVQDSTTSGINHVENAMGMDICGKHRGQLDAEALVKAHPKIELGAAIEAAEEVEI